MPAVAEPAPVGPAHRRVRLSLAGAAVAVVLVVIALVVGGGGGGSDHEAAPIVDSTTTTAATDTPTGNQAPEVEPLSVTFAVPVTTYAVSAADADGDSLTYEWTKDDQRPCGEFTASGDTARWSHPHPPCPDEPVHPSVITVVVSDGHGHSVSVRYTGGSAPTDAREPAAPGEGPTD